MLRVMKGVIQSTLARFGYHLVRGGQPPPEPLSRFFAMLKRQGFNPKYVIDVGAHKGSWTRCALRYFPDTLFTLIEPQAELRQHVQDLVDFGYNIEWLTAGAGDKSGVLDFTINPRPDSSTFRLSGPLAAGFTRYGAKVCTLNEVAKSHDTVPEMVKIDTEGFDLKVLAGASDLIGTTDIFLVEAAVVASDIENTAAKVIEYMTGLGYRLIDITDVNRSPKHDVLWLCELAFLKADSDLFDAIASYE